MSAGPVFPFNMIIMQPDPFFTIRVNRDSVVEDAMVALRSCKNIDLKKPLKVNFGIFWVLLFMEDTWCSNLC